MIKRRTRIRSVSAKRAPQLRAYSKARQRYLAENPLCMVWLHENEITLAPAEARIGSPVLYFLQSRGCPLASDVHHKRGRVGAMLLAEEHWMAVSREAHERIHRQPSEARAKGWLA